jgi:hypothetical protein
MWVCFEQLICISSDLLLSIHSFNAVDNKHDFAHSGAHPITYSAHKGFISFHSTNKDRIKISYEIPMLEKNDKNKNDAYPNSRYLVH